MSSCLPQCDLPTLYSTNSVSRAQDERIAVIRRAPPFKRTRRRSMSSTASATLPPSLLLSVLSRVPGLLTLIAPYLFPRHKLSELSRLCHSFPPLSPACFRYDHLDISERTAVILPLLSHSHYTLAKLAQIRHLRCVYKVDDFERAAVNQHFLALFLPSPAAPAPLCPFSSLHSMALTVPSDNVTFVQQLFASSPPRFPHLSTLDIGCESTERDLLPLDVQLLCGHLPALTSLTLRCCSISGRSFLQLCSLPLLKLDCTDQCDVLLDEDDVDDGNERSTARSSSFRVLLFPSLHPLYDGPPRSQFKLVDHLLRPYSVTEPTQHDRDENETDSKAGDESAAGPSGLVALHFFGERIPLATVRLISQIPSLTWLDLSECFVRSLAPLLNETGGPQLVALKHFSAPLAIPGQWAGQDVEEDEDMTEAEAEGDWHSWVSVVLAYGPQLHLLELNLPTDSVSAHFGATLLQAVFSASDLRELSLGVWYAEEFGIQGMVANVLNRQAEWVKWCSHSLPLIRPQPTLYLVGDLVLYGLPTNNHELSCLLQLLPNVQDCRLADMGCLTLDILPICGRACPKLRKLEVIAEKTNHILAQPVADIVWCNIDEDTAVLFPNLLTLAVAGRWTDVPFHKKHMQPLARLLSHSAPQLRYLFIDIDCPLHLLPPFSTLPLLRAFRAFVQLPAALCRCFRRPPADERARIWSEYHRERPQYKCEVMSVEEMECMELVRDVRAGWDKEGQKQRDDCYVFASGDSGWGGGAWDVNAAGEVGQWGRRGFFEALTSMVLENGEPDSDEE